VLKHYLAVNAPLEPGRLHFHKALLAVLGEARAKGRKVVLATAADRLQAEGVAAHLGLFDEVIASGGRTNLKGRRKAEALVARFGLGGFDYIGDSTADLPVWLHARRALLARADARRPRLLIWRVRRAGMRLGSLDGVQVPPVGYGP